MYFDPVLERRKFELLKKHSDDYYEDLQILKNSDQVKKDYEKRKWRKIFVYINILKFFFLNNLSVI